jgi:hypothetical protein
MNRTLVALPVLALAACGYTDAGSGTNTLLVAADASFTVGDDNTRLSVHVHKAGVAVDGATVNMRDGDTNELFTLRNTGSGTYTLDTPRYRRRLALEVQAANTSGGSADSLVAKLEGPGPHVIVNPKAGGLTRGSQGSTLDVEWACNDGVGADQVSVHVDDGFSRLVTGDSGKTDGPPMATLASGNHDLRVRRINTVELSGGVTGSVFTVSFGVQSSFDIL